MGFSSERDYSGQYDTETFIDLSRYILFCEMILNLIYGLNLTSEYWLEEPISIIVDTIRKTVEKAGLEIRNVDGHILINEKML